MQAGQRQGGSGSGRASNTSGRASIKSRQSGRSVAGSVAADFPDSSSAGISQPRKLSVTSKNTESQSHTPDRRASRHAEASASGMEQFRMSHPAAMNGGAAVRGDDGAFHASSSGMPTLRQPPSEPGVPGGHEITAYVSRTVQQPGVPAGAHAAVRPEQRGLDRPRSDPAQASHPETSHDGTSSSFLSNTSWNTREAQRERERSVRSASAPRPRQTSAPGGMPLGGAGAPLEFAAPQPPPQQPGHRQQTQSHRQRQRRRAMQQLLSEGEVSDYTETTTSTRSRTPSHVSPPHHGSTWSASIWDSMPHQMEPGAPRGGPDGQGRSPVASNAVRRSSRSWHGGGTGTHEHLRPSNSRAAEAHAAAQHAAARSPSRGYAVQSAHVEVEDDPLPRGVGIGMPRNLRAALNAAHMEAEEAAGQRRSRQWY